MDHSLVEELIRSGQLERNKGRNHPEKNIITRAMGSRDEAVPDFFVIDRGNNLVKRAAQIKDLEAEIKSLL
jgi:protein phosphatase